MHRIDAVFNQPVLHQGIHISCRSIFGYHYRIKNSEDQSFTSIEFIQEFVKQINQSIRRNAIWLRVVDVLALIIILTLSSLCLAFSPTFLDDQIPYLIFVILVVIFGISFIYMKFKNISNLNKKVEVFLDGKKEELTRLGFRAILIKAKLYDRAPDVFLNLLPAKSALGLKSSDSESLQLREDIEHENEYGEYKKSNLKKDSSSKEIIINVMQDAQADPLKVKKLETLSNEDFGDMDEGNIEVNVGEKPALKPSKV